MPARKRVFLPSLYFLQKNLPDVNCPFPMIHFSPMSRPRYLAAVKRSLLLKHSIALAVFLVGGFTQNASVAATRPTSFPFESPKGDYVSQRDQHHTFRIPGMIVTQDGTILLFAEARRGTGRDPRREDNAPIDLIIRHSTDNGDTWERRCGGTVCKQIWFFSLYGIEAKMRKLKL